MTYPLTSCVISPIQAYFIYKLVRLFEPSQAYRYAVSRKTLATFSIISLLILALTFAVSVMCYLNFGKGLKEQSESSVVLGLSTCSHLADASYFAPCP